MQNKPSTSPSNGNRIPRTSDSGVNVLKYICYRHFTFGLCCLRMFEWWNYWPIDCRMIEKQKLAKRTLSLISAQQGNQTELTIVSNPLIRRYLRTMMLPRTMSLNSLKWKGHPIFTFLGNQWQESHPGAARMTQYDAIGSMHCAAGCRVSLDIADRLFFPFLFFFLFSFLFFLFPLLFSPGVQYKLLHQHSIKTARGSCFMVVGFIVNFQPMRLVDSL